MVTAQLSAIVQEIAAKVPKGLELCLYHFFSKASCAENLNEKVKVRSHFYAITQDNRLAFAIEIVCHQTKERTTFYVAKADSTGCRASR